MAWIYNEGILKRKRHDCCSKYIYIGYSIHERVVSAADGVISSRRTIGCGPRMRGFSANSILKLSFVTSRISLQLRPPADRSRSVHQTT